MPDDWEFLRKIPLFKDLEDPELEVMIAIMEEVVFPAGSTVFREGATASSVFIVRSGVVDVACKEVDGTEQVVATLGTGQSLGEMALVRKTTRSATARARESTSLLVLKNEKLHTLSERQPRIWGKIVCNIASILADRLESMDHELTRLAAAPAGRPLQRGLFTRLLGR